MKNTQFSLLCRFNTWVDVVRIKWLNLRPTTSIIFYDYNFEVFSKIIIIVITIALHDHYPWCHRQSGIFILDLVKNVRELMNTQTKDMRIQDAESRRHIHKHHSDSNDNSVKLNRPIVRLITKGFTYIYVKILDKSHMFPKTSRIMKWLTMFLL